jgi:hypothetical protein
MISLNLNQNSSNNNNMTDDNEIILSSRSKNTNKSSDNNIKSFSNIIQTDEEKKFLENLDNSFEKLEKAKLEEIDDLFSPFDSTAKTISSNNNKKDITMFKLTDSVNKLYFIQFNLIYKKRF